MPSLLPALVAASLFLLSEGSSDQVSSNENSSPDHCDGGTSGFGAFSREDMQALQYDLAWLGYYLESAYGTWNDATALALEGFQDDHGLSPVDGLPGPDTLKTLDSVIASQP